RAAATPVPAALTANAAPTAALPINSRRESIVHPFRRNERNRSHGSPIRAPTCRTALQRCFPSRADRHARHVRSRSRCRDEDEHRGQKEEKPERPPSWDVTADTPTPPPTR